MEETRTKVALDRDSYQSVLDMLDSVDEESVKLGLYIIEETDHKRGLVYILMLRKDAKVLPDLWKKYSPQTVEKMKDYGADFDTVMTFKKMLGIITKQKVTPDQMQFYSDRVAKHLLTEMHQLNYTFIESIEIKLKFKTDE